MELKENISLKPYNTFGIDVKAKQLALFRSEDDLAEILNDKSISKRKMVLGGGSNILFTKDFDGVVLKNEIDGIEQLHEDEEYVYVKAGGGVNWHRFVLHCIDMNWGAAENLSLIPGNVGAAPMQNIGAYGVELQEIFWDLDAYDLEENKLVNFTTTDCAFGYRDSVFKNKYKDKFAIMQVTFRLNKQPRFNTSYGAIESELEKMGVKELSIKAISDAVIRIRSSKLPDPAKIGNAGSFFKNPIVPDEKFAALKKSFPRIVGYPSIDGNVKLAAAWMIELCGWKGYRDGNAGVHNKQALVLVNYGNARGSQINELAEKIKTSVQQKFGVTLEKEVNIV
jgi:UDP-N-acetylmuramate dehydrogenase